AAHVRACSAGIAACRDAGPPPAARRRTPRQDRIWTGRHACFARPVSPSIRREIRPLNSSPARDASIAQLRVARRGGLEELTRNAAIDRAMRGARGALAAVQD